MRNLGAQSLRCAGPMVHWVFTRKTRITQEERRPVTHPEKGASHEVLVKFSDVVGSASFCSELRYTDTSRNSD